MTKTALAKAERSDPLEVEKFETDGGTIPEKNYPASPQDCSDSDSESHKKHACYLKSKGYEPHITLKDPTIECRHCGTKVNCAEHVCAAHMGEEAANVEGGHGIIGLDQIGKSHAC